MTFARNAVQCTGKGRSGSEEKYSIMCGIYMRKNGAMFICNRCRKQVFAERIDDGKYDSKPLDGWALDCERICGVGDLCPDCFKAYREAMDGFWNGGKHGI